MSALNTTPNREEFRVLHPLDDIVEKKCSSEGLGPIWMTRPVRISLAVLRGYLVVMTLMLAYHFLDLAGVLSRLQ